MFVYVIKTNSGYLGLDNGTFHNDYVISFEQDNKHYGKYIRRFIGKNILAFPNENTAKECQADLANRETIIEKYFVSMYANNLDEVIANTCKNFIYKER